MVARALLGTAAKKDAYEGTNLIDYKEDHLISLEFCGDGLTRTTSGPNMHAQKQSAPTMKALGPVPFADCGKRNLESNQPQGIALPAVKRFGSCKKRTILAATLDVSSPMAWSTCDGNRHVDIGHHQLLRPYQGRLSLFPLRTLSGDGSPLSTDICSAFARKSEGAVPAWNFFRITHKLSPDSTLYERFAFIK